jgi:2-amino-4-hydroxy-6-hydroxymethyldihydropteridine diphosphokinase
MTTCLIALGANLGPREANLARAVEMLSDHPRIEFEAVSRWSETAPVGGPAGQGPFLNAVARLETTLSAVELFDHIRWIEKNLGRQRAQRWAARTIDLDLLLFGDAVISDLRLCVPHPRMAVRRFVLQPAAEVAAQMVHPVVGWTIAKLLDHLDSSPPYIAIAGPPGAGKTALAAELASRLPARQINVPTDVAPAVDPNRAAQDASQMVSDAWNREVAFMETLVTKLAAVDWPDSAQFVVSDFWFDQSLAYAEMNLPADRLPAFRRQWRVQREQIPAPRFTVLLGPYQRPFTPPVPPENLDPLDGKKNNESDDTANALARVAMQPVRGPVLWLSNADHRQALDEVLAAVESMR